MWVRNWNNKHRNTSGSAEKKKKEWHEESWKKNLIDFFGFAFEN
jgi:hypothetical protein